MPRCYFVPGIPGVDLLFKGPPPSPYWAFPGQIALQGLGPLRLDPDGVSPGAPDGKALIPGGPVLAYYGNTMLTLQSQLQQAANGDPKYVVAGVGYDWRLDMIGQGKLFAQLIRNEASISDPCSMVCHSQGGLIARAAWADLVRTGDTALVRRIVTMGTPHKGSLSPVNSWSLADNFIKDLSTATYLANGLIARGQAMSPTEVAALTATWPAFYQLLPAFQPLGSPPPDDNLWGVYEAKFYQSGVGVQQKWLDYAKNVWQPFLASPAAKPPPWIITSVASQGLPTPFRINRAVDAGYPFAMEFDNFGDGTVMFGSANAVSGRQVTVNGLLHSSMHNALVNAGLIHPLVLEDRGAPSPPLVNPNPQPDANAAIDTRLFSATIYKPVPTYQVEPIFPIAQNVQLPFVPNVVIDSPGSTHLVVTDQPSPSPSPGPGPHC